MVRFRHLYSNSMYIFGLLILLSLFAAGCWCCCCCCERPWYRIACKWESKIAWIDRKLDVQFVWLFRFRFRLVWCVCVRVPTASIGFWLRLLCLCVCWVVIWILNWISFRFVQRKWKWICVVEWIEPGLSCLIWYWYGWHLCMKPGALARHRKMI